MRTFLLLFLASLAAWQPGMAQVTATLQGTVLDPSEAAVPGADVRLTHPLSGFRSEAVTDSQGRFRFSNLPYRRYRVEVRRDGLGSHVREVQLRTNLPVEISVRLDLATLSETVTVGVAAATSLLDTRASGTRTQLSASAIEKMPIGPGARGLEAILLGFPGFASNANGSLHPRGAHNQLTYVIDGMPVSDQFTGQFATSIDPNQVQALELFTGNIPPEFGSKVSGVVNVTTRSGFDRGGRSFGQAEVGGGFFDALTQALQAGGASRKFGWFGSISSLKTNRFLDPPSFDNLHNGGNAQRASARFDYRLSPRHLFRMTTLGGRSSFQLANLRSQHLNGQQQRRMLRDNAVSVGYVGVVSPSATFDSTTSYRAVTARLFPSAGDTPVTADLFRTLSTLSSLNRFNWQRGGHQLRAGADWQRFSLGERFAFGLTDPALNAPGASEFNSSLSPFDLSRGGSWFRFRDRGSGHLLGLFLHDRVRWKGLMLDLGVRVDRYAMVVRASALQPRVGLAYHLAPTRTVLRVSYNRNLQTPPNENLLLANSRESAALAPPLISRQINGGLIPIRPERQNVYEAGLQQDLGGRASLDLAYYHKDSINAQDNDNFLNTGVIFPTSLASQRVNGFEARLTVPEARKFTGYLSLTHFRAIMNPPFTGGLFLGSTAVEALSSGPFYADHDQLLGVSGNLVYRPARRWWTSWQARYDSGLVPNASDPADVAADPDYSDQLPFVDLLSSPPRIRPRTILDASLGYEHYRGDRRAWEIVLQVSNLTDRQGLYNFQSIFVGTRVIQPRAASLRLRLFW